MNQSDLPKKIKFLIRNLKNGDLSSSFYLANYIEEENLEIDGFNKDKILNEIYEILNNNKIRLKSLKITDYKKFKNLKINFDKKTTVLIGDNGAGKTSILEAISKQLNYLSDVIRSPLNSNYKFSDSEINVDSIDGYSTITCEISAGNSNFQCLLSKNLDTNPRRVLSELEQFKTLGAMYQKANQIAPEDCSFPLLAYYPVERSITTRKDDINRRFERDSKSHIPKKVDGLQRSSDGQFNFESFLIWFRTLDDIINENKASNSISVDDLGSLINKSDGNIDTIREYMTSFLKNTGLKDKSDIEIYRNQLNLVKSTIIKFLPNIQDLSASRVPNFDIKVTKDNKKISIFNLSQGEKTLLALISDISRRLVVLNPGLDNPLKGTGIVIIDEIDLHLHPLWQQIIIERLEETFPNINFILSTHSPIVLTTVTNSQILKLDTSADLVSVITPSINPYGKESSEGLAIMDTLEKPTLKNGLNELLHYYESLVKTNKEHSKEASEVYDEIIKTGYSIDESDLELWRFIASNSNYIKD